MGYSFMIEYRIGKSNRATDVLSRREEEVEIQIVFVLQWTDWDQINVEVQQDSELRKIIQDLQTGTQQHINYSLIHGR